MSKVTPSMTYELNRAYTTPWFTEPEQNASPVTGGVAFIRETIRDMTPAQFDVYEAAIRSQPYGEYAANPDLATALQEVNRRRANESTSESRRLHPSC